MQRTNLFLLLESESVKQMILLPFLCFVTYRVIWYQTRDF